MDYKAELLQLKHTQFICMRNSNNNKNWKSKIEKTNPTIIISTFMIWFGHFFLHNTIFGKIHINDHHIENENKNHFLSFIIEFLLFETWFSGGYLLVIILIIK